jgi:hypothetical protein
MTTLNLRILYLIKETLQKNHFAFLIFLVIVIAVTISHFYLMVIQHQGAVGELVGKVQIINEY